MHTPDLLGFGIVLWLGGVLVVLSQLHSKPSRTAPRHALPLQSEASPSVEELAELRQECQRLRRMLQDQRSLALADAQQDLFNQLQPLLTSYPTLRKMVEVQPDLPMKNGLALLTALDQWLQTGEIQTIGAPWQTVLFDPQVHAPDSDSITPGDSVYVRFVGYRQGDRILCPARVSRTHPGPG